jgi:hypothetical protein
MAKADDRRAGKAPNDGRSVERARQDDAIDQAAHRESWIAQLLRGFKSSKGRPKPGDRKTDV